MQPGRLTAARPGWLPNCMDREKIQPEERSEYNCSISSGWSQPEEFSKVFFGLNLVGFWVGGWVGGGSCVRGFLEKWVGSGPGKQNPWESLSEPMTVAIFLHASHTDPINVIVVTFLSRGASLLACLAMDTAQLSSRAAAYQTSQPRPILPPGCRASAFGGRRTRMEDIPLLPNGIPA